MAQRRRKDQGLGKHGRRKCWDKMGSDTKLVNISYRAIKTITFGVTILTRQKVFVSLLDKNLPANMQLYRKCTLISS